MWLGATYDYKTFKPATGGAIGPLTQLSAPAPAPVEVPATGGVGWGGLLATLIPTVAQVGTGIYAVGAASKVERAAEHTRRLQVQLQAQQQAQLLSQVTKVALVLAAGYFLYRIVRG